MDRAMPFIGSRIDAARGARAYIWQLGLAAAVSQFELWCGIIAGAILWWLILAAAPPHFNTAAIICGGFGPVSVLDVRPVGVVRPLPLPRVVRAGFGVGHGAREMLARLQLRAVLQVGRRLPAAGVLAAFGLLITFDAYRRWLRMDFD